MGPFHVGLFVVLLASLTASPVTARLSTQNHVLPLATAPPIHKHTRHARQVLSTTTTTIRPTRTITATATNVDETPTITSSQVLQPATTPIDVAATIGLVMPNPWSNLYVGVNYTFGFVDAVKRPAPTTGGWLRLVQPLILFPNYTLAIFPGSGASSPEDESAIPEGSGGLCGTTAERYSVGYSFRFQQHGWHMFIINETYSHATINTNDNTCQLPIVENLFFFATQSFSVQPAPTGSPGPADPTSPFTVFNKVSTQAPGSLPYDKKPSTGTERLAVGLGVTGGALALAGIVAVIWWVKKRRLMEAETLAFSRLSERDKAAFLAENPEHFLNPNRRLHNPPLPSAPPSTVAYAQWYWQQLWDRQHGNGNWTRGQLQPGRNGWNQPMHDHWGVPGHTQQALHQEVQQQQQQAPVLVYKTY